MAFCYDPDNNQNCFSFRVPREDNCSNPCMSCQNWYCPYNPYCRPHRPTPPVVAPALPVSTVALASVNSTATLAKNTIYLSGVYLSATATASKIRIAIANAQSAVPVAPGKNTVGLYGAPDNFYHPSELVMVSGSQNESWSTVGEKLITTNIKTLPAGKYYIAIICQADNLAVRSSSIMPAIDPPDKYFGSNKFLKVSAPVGVTFDRLPVTIPAPLEMAGITSIYAVLE